ncbi:uncharacterized protein LOC135927366 [Gordionus sp. m RMFG-2023]|uniref:uncharacterized protein LOC135927366 n=1 Tax=Gordionus sp. m RMFG-2023 TaxID=3053472 RepID=UPI0031FC52C5
MKRKSDRLLASLNAATNESTRSLESSCDDIVSLQYDDKLCSKKREKEYIIAIGKDRYPNDPKAKKNGIIKIFKAFAKSPKSDKIESDNSEYTCEMVTEFQYENYLDWKDTDIIKEILKRPKHSSRKKK